MRAMLSDARRVERVRRPRRLAQKGYELGNHGGTPRDTDSERLAGKVAPTIPRGHPQPHRSRGERKSDVAEARVWPRLQPRRIHEWQSAASNVDEASRLVDRTGVDRGASRREETRLGRHGGTPRDPDREGLAGKVAPTIPR